jgi:hypothetical protein
MTIRLPRHPRHARGGHALDDPETANAVRHVGWRGTQPAPATKTRITATARRGQHRPAGDADHHHHEARPRVVQIVARLKVDEVAARLPERRAGGDHARPLPPRLARRGGVDAARGQAATACAAT